MTDTRSNHTRTLDRAALDRVCGGVGTELDMIGLQSLISQRQQAVQLTSNVLKKMNDTTSAIAHNIGG